ncbi:hypothetical protein [Vallicoccus soli]|uniref:Uncharacterized protein n=1 Tax=Vallicoccus soli TaxID=2339232 RepID=A0A3A3Z1B0_9ACTN|nr:hypothetical protein [Vallicoccus soli]RJK96963.1 hypothetical protein D5H78_06890 [Vallicoccus soli]
MALPLALLRPARRPLLRPARRPLLRPAGACAGPGQDAGHDVRWDYEHAYDDLPRRARCAACGARRELPDGAWRSPWWRRARAPRAAG